MNAPTTVEFKPYKNPDGSHRIEGLSVGQRSMTDVEYHGARESISKMRKDPEAAKLFDKYLEGVKKGNVDLGQADLTKLDEAMKKSGISRGAIVNDVGADMKAHRYDPYHKPNVMIEVNGRAMSPEAVRMNMESQGIKTSGTAPKSDGIGKVSHNNLSVDKENLTKVMSDKVEAMSHRNSLATIEQTMGKNGANILAQVGEHAGGILKKLPIISKLATAASLTIAGMGVANASTPEESQKAKDHLKSEMIDLIDPTMGIVSKGVPAALKDLEENGDRRKAESKVNPHNLRIQRAQEFILSDQHPGQLGALKLKDSAGKDVNVVETLRNPATRQTVMSEIDTRLSNATSPEMKDQFQGMKQAAVEFSSLQDRIKAPAVAAPAAQPQQMAAKTPVKEMELSLQ